MLVNCSLKWVKYFVYLVVSLVTLIVSISLEKYNNIIKGFWYCLDEGITLTELLLVFTMIAQCSSALNGWWNNKTWYYKITGNYLIILLHFKQKTYCLLDWQISFLKKTPLREIFNSNKSTSNVIFVVLGLFFFDFFNSITLKCGIQIV